MKTMKKLDKEEAERVRQKALKAINEGHIEYSHPLAPTCFPITDTPEKGFLYLKAEFLEPIAKGCIELDPEYYCDGGIRFLWGKKGFGFGELYITMKDGKTDIDDEGLGKEFVQDLLLAWADQIVGDEDGE